MTVGILDGVRVIDLARYVAGPMAAALLADLGADVIRVEPPGGAEDRAPLPFADGFHGGAGFTQTGRNKRGLSLDIATPQGRTVLEKLVATADIVIANLPANAVAALGIDYDSLAAVKPDIIYLHLTAFGTEGPYAERVGFDAIAQVMSGMPHLSGDPSRPMKSAAAWVDMATGFLGAFGILAALRHRDATGEGQKVEANLWQTALTVGNYFLIEQAFTGMDRDGTGNRAPSGAPADLLPTRDGWIYVAVLGNAMFGRFARLIDDAGLADDARFRSDENRARHGEALSALAATWSKALTTDEAVAQLANARIPAGPMLSPRAILVDPHFRAAMLRSVDVPGLDPPVPYVAPPVSFTRTPAMLRHGPPAIGEHNHAILREIDYSDEAIEALRSNGTI